MIGLYKFLRVAVVAAIVLAVLPRPALAQDGCGLVQAFLVGCTYDQDERELERENARVMAEIEAQSAARILAAQQQADQLRYQQWLASEQARTELEHIAARERVDRERILVELEMMYARERMAGVQATTSFNIAALQSDAMIAVANARAAEAAANQVTAALIVLAVLIAAGAVGFAAWQWRRSVEVQAAPRLLPPDEWQRRAVDLLEQRGIPWMLEGRKLLAQRGDGEWVQVERN